MTAFSFPVAAKIAERYSMLWPRHAWPILYVDAAVADGLVAISTLLPALWPALDCQISLYRTAHQIKLAAWLDIDDIKSRRWLRSENSS